MNTLQLQCVLRARVATRDIKVISSDRLPSLRMSTYPKGFIVNNQSSYQKGQHWVAIWLENPSQGEFFDSFGETPLYYGKQFQNFMKCHVTRYIHNTVQLQNKDSSTCGLYVLFYLVLKTYGYSLKRIQRCFTNDTKLNDDVLYQFADQYFNKCECF